MLTRKWDEPIEAAVAAAKPREPAVGTGVRAYERRIDLRTNNPMR